MKLFKVIIFQDWFRHFSKGKKKFKLSINDGILKWHSYKDSEKPFSYIDPFKYGTIYLDDKDSIIGEIESPIMLSSSFLSNMKFEFDKNSTIEDIEKTIENKLNSIFNQ